MTNTVIAVYDEFAHAQSAMKQLLSSGFTSSNVHLRPSEDSQSGRTAALQALGQSDTDSQAKSASGGTLRGFFRELFGGHSNETQSHGTHYEEAVRRGSFVLVVDAADEQERDVATSVMEQFQPVDIDERAQQWRANGWSGTEQTTTPMSDEELALERSGRSTTGGAAALAGATGMTGTTGTTGMTGTTGATGITTTTDKQQVAIPVIEEELQVGKREVQRGGIRVYQRVVETPVQESIGLREEHVTIERHAVDQPATAADLASLKEGTFEVREMAEEAVVSKTARVVEEVVLGKEVSEKETTISDTVRRTDVEVEKIDTPTRTSSATPVGGSTTAGRGGVAGTTGTTDTPGTSDTLGTGGLGTKKPS